MKTKVLTYLKPFREKILEAFEKIEGQKSFERSKWDYQQGEGGGEMAVLRGQRFEKAAVNFSEVSGKTFPGSDATGPFYATGVSLITHMMSPHAPTVHMNLRYIETSKKSWLAGGYDLTPMGHFYNEDTKHFLKTAEDALDPFGLYLEFYQNAKEYFYLPHRKKERGIGGLFFDHLNSGNRERDFAVWKAVGESFLPAILPIYQQRAEQIYTPEERALQLQMRGHYAEFNLHYDRGTKFGFLSGGNPDAILCSLPPVATW